MIGSLAPQLWLGLWLLGATSVGVSIRGGALVRWGTRCGSPQPRFVVRDWCGSAGRATERGSQVRPVGGEQEQTCSCGPGSPDCRSPVVGSPEQLSKVLNGENVPDDEIDNRTIGGRGPSRFAGAAYARPTDSGDGLSCRPRVRDSMRATSLGGMASGLAARSRAIPAACARMNSAIERTGPAGCRSAAS